DPRLDGVDVSQELEDPTDMQCPAVRIILVDAPREPWVIVAASVVAGQDRILVHFDFHCWALSAQGTADAARQRDALVKTVVDVIRDNPFMVGSTTLSDATNTANVDFVTVKGVSFDLRRTEGGIYASGVVGVEAQ